MNVDCERDEWFMFSPKEIDMGYRRLTTYKGLKIGTIYNVYGIVLFKYGLNYLVWDEYEMANWYPVELFKVNDPHIPADWYYRFLGSDTDVTAIWGYKELATSEEHYEGLIEREPADIDLFYRRKQGIDIRSDGKIMIGKVGKIMAGDNKGGFVKIIDDHENTGGFLIFTSLSQRFQDSYDNWVQNKLDLERFFQEANWSIEWIDQS
jgi:hypothetical protein